MAASRFSSMILNFSMMSFSLDDNKLSQYSRIRSLVEAPGKDLQSFTASRRSTADSNDPDSGNPSKRQRSDHRDKHRSGRGGRRSRSRGGRSRGQGGSAGPVGSAGRGHSTHVLSLTQQQLADLNIKAVQPILNV